MVPHKTFERLRNEDPIFWTKEKNGRGFWSILRHQDILRVNQTTKYLVQKEAFELKIKLKTNISLGELFRKQPTGLTEPFDLFNPAFPNRKWTATNLVRELASNINEATQNNKFEAVDAIAKKLPMLMLGELGVPEINLDWLVQKGDALIGNSDPDFQNLLSIKKIMKNIG